MPRTLYLRCPRCEHDNDPEYRFCGMCGTSLSIASRREAGGEPRRQTEGEMDVTSVRQGGVWQKAPAQPEAPKRAEPSNSYSPGKSEPLLENTPVEAAAQYKHIRNEQAHPSRRPSEGRDSVPLSGPSFLGLADNTAQSASYLLEDEEPAGGRRRTFALLFVILAVGSFLLWHWKHTGNIYPWEAGRTGDHASTAKVSPSAPQGAPLAQTQTTPMDAGNASVGSAQPKPAPADTKPASPPPRAAAPDQVPNSPINEGDADTIQNDDAGGKTIQEPSKAASSSTASSAPASSAAPASSSATSRPPANSAPTGNAAVAAAAPAVSAKKPGEASRASATNKVSKAPLPPPAPDKTREAQDKDKGDPLFIQGQRYLYGTGVRQNCDLAQKSLMTAAQNSNVQAQSTLATMFATGHCAPRSLPLAYRWFAKASHQEPNNPRIEKNLEILWKQMTPEEKQAAIQNR
jgi:hypothetical protein